MGGAAEPALRILRIGGPGRLERGVDRELASGFDVECVSSEAAADESFGARAAAFDAILVDGPSLPRGETVHRTLGRLLQREPGLKVIVLAADGDPAAADAALAAGAWDVAPLGGETRLVPRLRAAGALRRLETDGGDEGPAEGRPRRMIGASHAMRDVLAQIDRLAPSDAPVLILGESGSGKELAARTIHARGPRSLGPFVPIRCIAAEESVFGSPPFAPGCEGGGGDAGRAGTLFLEGIGELAPALQAMLLRFLEDRGERGAGRVGVDLRVIAATSRDLRPDAAPAGLRDDLHRRLAASVIDLPPLRARPEDLLLLAHVELRRHAREVGRALRGFSPGAIDAMWRWSWPGNVRELVHRLRRAAVVAEGPFITPSDLDLEPDPDLDPDGLDAPLLTLREAQVRAEIECIQRALARTGGNRSRAARALGISRSTLYELLRRHSLE
jgi:two-component system NtrC family response regulator